MTARPRREDIRANLERVRSRIAEAATEVGRDPASVTLIVVTKFFPVDDLRLLSELGVRDMGESRHPEAADKHAALAGSGVIWHFVGQVQTNKAAAVASYADLVHSVDSDRLAVRLGSGATRAGRVVPALLQVNLDPSGSGAGRGGVAPAAIPALARTVAGTEGLLLKGLMAVAPREAPAAEAFARLAHIWREVRTAYPCADLLSAGMSGDFAEAIRAGATHVRVGSAVLGSRPSLR